MRLQRGQSRFMVNNSAGEAANDRITVEVAYALPDRQALLTLSVSSAASVEQILHISQCRIELYQLFYLLAYL
ncbi:RnfH family protein [Alishewanella longhuensis]